MTETKKKIVKNKIITIRRTDHVRANEFTTGAHLSFPLPLLLINFRF